MPSLGKVCPRCCRIRAMVEHVFVWEDCSAKQSCFSPEFIYFFLHHECSVLMKRRTFSFGHTWTLWRLFLRTPPNIFFPHFSSLWFLTLSGREGVLGGGLSGSPSHRRGLAAAGTPTKRVDIHGPVIHGEGRDARPLGDQAESRK